MTTDRAAPLVHRWLPVRYDVPHGRACQSRLLTTFALQRSGQHLVIDWMCRGLVDALHVNNCRFFRDRLSIVLTPLTGRRVVYRADGVDDSGVQGRRAYRPSLPDPTPANLVYSLENQSLSRFEVRKLLARFETSIVVILRDPANWLASSLRHGLQERETLRANIDIFKEYLRFANALAAGTRGQGIAINFSRFTEDEDYRRRLGESLGLASFDRAEEALRHTPDFGGGSSFKGEQGQSQSVHDRYLEYRADPFFQKVLGDRELIDLAETFFGPLPHLSAIAAVG